MPSKHVQREFTRVRRLVREVIFEHGFTLNDNDAPPELSNLISDVAHRNRPMAPTSRRLEERIEQAAGRELMLAVSDHFGALMVSRGDAGYFVGVCAGLELAALALGTSAPVIEAIPAPYGPAMPKRGKRSGGA